MGQAQKCAGVKHVYEISILPYTSSKVRKVNNSLCTYNFSIFATIQDKTRTGTPFYLNNSNILKLLLKKGKNTNIKKDFKLIAPWRFLNVQIVSNKNYQLIVSIFWFFCYTIQKVDKHF